MFWLSKVSLAAWVAQDHIYHSRDPNKARRAQEMAWFGLWQTESMGEVMEYIVHTQATPNPLYLASFDIQPGASREFGGSGDAALNAFLSALGRYKQTRNRDDFARWRGALEPIFGCLGFGPPINPN
jgi:hypothetical protein